MRSVHHGPMAWLLGQVTLLATLATTVGLGGPGWGAGMTSAVVVDAGLARGLARRGADRMGPADRVTLTRATLVCGVAALTADAFLRPVPVGAFVALTVVALVLDSVDGAVARRTGTASALGARFDMEVDAFLILVLSAYAARSVGVWVLAIGLARYAFVAAGSVLPWMRGSLPPRYWRKVVAAVQGVVLAAAAAGVLPGPVVMVAVVAALALLTESFGRDVLWLWHHQRVGAEHVGAERVTPGPARTLHLGAGADGQLPAAPAPDGC
ncbi:CDP-alcohol phosphatidyltransferase [Intrasporangium oryzae NRRL B-24470]|uniref:CDP-alcohol phosphatidyltransferase n=1 Tax=Intrasporangium oryzae NRRL B-24470 TaxID=1386089 RepID=W9G978_9MICO|nr:CDP-alcohol phosphatidyltransferase family protein [Intrasporangium oryzae]EWT02585.1 CDP-alcohol phosphatidyltransferase [Intrasporangium oryzae NRRL B-24470]